MYNKEEGIYDKSDTPLVKKKRGRPRKVATLPEEIVKVINEVKAKEEEEFKDIVYEEKKKRNGGWDFTLDDEIPFFDENMSYELTGYRPINKTEGLDFDPSWFTEARDTFKKTGHYCQYPRNTKAYADFWTLQYRYCRDGMTVNGYTITGDHYYFLNFYQLMDLTSAKKAGEGRLFDFPKFFVEQYKWFHYLELCKKLRLNAGLMKARGVGFSEMDASLSSNTYNSRRNSVTVIAALQENYLSKTLDKVWKALTFLNDYTDGGFFKLRQVSDSLILKKASHYKIVNGQKIEDGWMSQIQGIVADKPNKIRGDRTDLLIYEEGGSWPSSTKAFIQGDALTGIQGARFGIKIIGGTGGDTGPALEGLKDIYENPDVYDVLKYRHRYTQSGAEVLTGFFIPAFNLVNKEGYIDNRGYTDPELGKKYYDGERAKKAKDPKALLIYCAEFCYNAEEAFSLEGDNKFNKIAISDLLARINILKEGPKVETGFLEYTYRDGKRDDKNAVGFKWVEDPGGKVHIIEHPLWTLGAKINEETGEVERPAVEKTNNLYVAGIDSIDIGLDDTSEFTKDPSKFCIVIKKRVYGLEEPQYVAYYKDRPRDVREAYKIAIRLAQYYNAPINIEATRMSMISWARDHGYLKYFMRRPRATFPNPNLAKRNTYGSPATVAVISHQTDLIADFIEDYCHNIWFTEMLEELKSYNDENKTKFDIVAALGMVELADEELTGIVPSIIEDNPENEFQDVGYYTDERGYKRFGVIPKQIKTYKPQVNYHIFQGYDNPTLYRSSDPRINGG